MMLVAAAQFCATNEISKNQYIIEKLTQNASLKNASLICFPECTNLIAKDQQELREKAELIDNSETIKKIKSLARRYSIMISVGSLILKKSGQEKILNRGFLIGKRGVVSVMLPNAQHLFQ